MDQFETQNRTLARLLEVSLTLNANLDLHPLLDRILEAACEIMHSQAASIMLYDDKLDELRFVASNTPGTDFDQLAAIPVPLEGSVAGTVVRTGQPTMIQDALTDKRVYTPVGDRIGFQTRSLLAVPMAIRGKVVGVLEGVNKLDASWTTEDAFHLSILASHSAVAIRNAQQADSLQRAYDELSQLDKLKNDFIAVASHELRTPLGVILGYASFLQDEAKGEAGEYATMVLNSALHLRNLIEEMVNLRYLQRGDSDLIRETMPLAPVIEAAVHDVESTAAARGQHIEAWLSAEPLQVYVDRIKLVTALTNVLSNAIKFSPNAAIIQVTLERHAHETLTKITDSGVGIAPEHLEQIFEKFYQVEDHMTRTHQGMGVGLAIAKAIVEAHGGRIWAESEGLGKGSTLFIVLPIVE
ncbi:MAG TPA: GAF domain-containing sensor histidine kinase [Aggregatilineales bacterium]|nr:GAF domain-containing sensor histidine kinase [Aggregatilineales bacterium]